MPTPALSAFLQLTRKNIFYILNKFSFWFELFKFIYFLDHIYSSYLLPCYQVNLDLLFHFRFWMLYLPILRDRTKLESVFRKVFVTLQKYILLHTRLYDIFRYCWKFKPSLHTLFLHFDEWIFKFKLEKRIVRKKKKLVLASLQKNML